MAISATHHHLLMKLQPLLSSGSAILEIGEANWYGDISPESVGLVNTGNGFEIAKQVYSKLCEPSRVVSVDANGTEAALRLDLNYPLPPLGQFDLVINHGTAEHVFNIAQVFSSMHEACAVGGLMVHESPFTGWPDHGFYCLQPTLFYDLAAVNGYSIVLMAVESLKDFQFLELRDREHMTQLLTAGVPNNAMLFVAMRKQHPLAFRVPAQGYYAQSLSESGRTAWHALR